MTGKITRQELTELLASGARVALVETLRAEHYDAGHLPGAIHIHPDEVERRAPQLLPDRDATVVTYCSNVACSNSRVAAEKLARLGYSDVRRYEAGKQDWEQAGLPLERGAVPAV